MTSAASKKVPFAHAAQPVGGAKAKRPLGQGAHAEAAAAPRAAEALPCGHWEHAARAAEPVAALKVPAGQGVGVALPRGQKLPASQARGVDTLAPGHLKPAGQAAHALAPATPAKRPAVHAMHVAADVAATAAEANPALQLVQTAAPAALP